MASPNHRSQALIDIAFKTYRDEILGELTGSKRYTGAMVANAMEIARRGIAAGDPADTLLANLFANGSTDLRELADGIRSGRFTEETNPGLLDALLDYVTEQLEITNPRFFERRSR